MGVWPFFIILAAAIVLFLTEKLPIDLTAVLGLLALVLLGYLEPREAFAGFSSPTVVILISTFFVAAAFTRTGAAEWGAVRLSALIGPGERRTILAVMALAAFLSAFMNDIAATALLMPAVAGIAAQTNIPPSRLFIPLAFGTILGGMTTLIGTPPNMLVNDALRQAGQEPFRFLDFTPIGGALTVAGIAAVVLLSNRLLPRHPVRPRANLSTGDLARFYRLAERTFSLRIPKGAAVHGRTLADTHFANLVGVHVVALEREGKRHVIVRPDERLCEGDVLVVQGRIEALEDLLRFRGLVVSGLDPAVLQALQAEVTVTTAEVAGEKFVGRSLKDVDFRGQFGAVVFGIERRQQMIYRQVGSVRLELRDLLLLLGRAEAIEKLKAEPDLFVADKEFSQAGGVLSKLFVAEIPEGSPLAGMQIADTRMGELLGVRALGVVRGPQTFVSLGGRQILQTGDKLLLAGEAEQIDLLGQLAGMAVEAAEVETPLESQEVGVVEAVLSPRSALLGKTLIETRFRERYGFQVLAIWRAGRPWRSLLGQMALQFGDSLLLHGPRAMIPLLSEETDLVVLSDTVKAQRRTAKAPYAVLGLLPLILLPAFHLQRSEVAAFIAAAFVVLSGALTMEEAYREVNWRIVFFVGALIPFGAAFEHSGAAGLVAETALRLLGGGGPLLVLAIFVLVSSLISQAVDGSPAVVLLAPIALNLAAQLHVRPHPFLMGVALAASVSFLTPFSHKANLLVMAAGSYRPADYWRIGWVLSLLCAVLLLLLVPLLFPFYPPR